MNILFISAHRLGDAVLSTALLSTLQERYSQARFTIVCGPHVVDLFKHVPRCDAVIALPKRPYNQHWLSLWWRCVRQRWYMIVDVRSSLVSFGLWARYRKVVKGGRRPGHKIAQQARALGFPETIQPYLWLLDNQKKEARYILSGSEKWVAFSPTAGTPLKTWPASSFVKLGKCLQKLGFKIVIFYGTGTIERAQAAPVVQGLPKVCDVGGQYALDDVACLLQCCSLFVGNDSGLMHMAASLGVPTLGLFGPSCVSQYGPVGPCTMTLSAPGREGEGVMAQIACSTVFKAAQQLLRKTNSMLKRERDYAL